MNALSWHGPFAVGAQALDRVRDAQYAVVLMDLNMPLDVSFELGYVQQIVETAVAQLAITVAALIVGAFMMAKYLPKSRFGSWMVFRMPAGAGGRAMGPEAPGGSLPDAFENLLGQYGVAHTVLRPAGIATISGRRVHVVTDGEYIDRGTEVVVSEVDGARVVVRALNNEARTA